MKKYVKSDTGKKLQVKYFLPYGLDPEYFAVIGNKIYNRQNGNTYKYIVTNASKNRNHPFKDTKLHKF